MTTSLGRSVGRWGGRSRELGRLLTVWIIGSAVVPAVVACNSGTHPATTPAPTPTAELIEASLFLLGDAGDPAPNDPVLEALGAAVASGPTQRMVVFLGDNVYPGGLPDSAAPGRRDAERRLEAQIAAVVEHGGRVVFVPGNHDWAGSAPDGWDAVLRQERFVAVHGGAAARLLPGGGCPGPVVVDVGARLRLIVLDTQWWLHEGPKPTHPTSACPADAPDEVTDSLRVLLAARGDRHVGIVAHHPLLTGGVHGGHFGVLDHLFPLRHLVSWMWLPLPVIGSAYPIARASGISAQDLSGSANRAMRAALEHAFAEHPPLFHASGHEHSLQVLEGPRVPHLLVSGAGYYGHTTRVVELDRTRYAASASGFMRVDVLRDGAVRLGVLTVSERGEATESFSMWLTDSGGEP